MSTEVPDGAHQRRARINEMLTYINLFEARTLTQIQGYMYKQFGLKFKTSSEMINEAAMSGLLRADGHGFYRLTKKVEDVQIEKEQRLRKRIEAEIRPKLEKKIRKEVEKELLNKQVQREKKKLRSS